MSHKKKSFDDLSKGKYPRETLREVVRQVLNGLTYPQKASKDYGIPVRTIQHHVKLARDYLVPNELGLYEEISTVKDYMGPDPSLDADLEEKIRLYVQDTLKIGMPRSQDKFLMDIQTYINTFGIQVPRFNNGKPGPDYLKRLCKDRDGDESVKILSASEVNAYLVEDKEVSTWITGVKQYLMEGNGQLISQKKLVFFIESQVFLTNTIPKRPVSVMIIYDAECTLIRWIIVTDGSVLSHDWTQEQNSDAMFLFTQDGMLSPTTLRNAMILIVRHYEEKHLDGVAVLFLDHFLSNEFDLCTWEYCFDNYIYPIAIPRAISSGVRALNLGIMARYTSLMLFYMHNRFILMNYEYNEMNFTLMHKEVVFQVAAKSNLPTMLNMLKINKIVMKPKTQSEEEKSAIPVPVSDGPSTSNPPIARSPISEKSKPKGKTKATKKSKSVEMVTSSTQTAEGVITLNLAADDDDFDLLELKRMRQKYLVTTIRQQDFE